MNRSNEVVSNSRILTNREVREFSSQNHELQEGQTGSVLDTVNELVGLRNSTQSPFPTSVKREKSDKLTEKKSRWEAFDQISKDEVRSDSPKRSRLKKQPSRFNRLKNRNPSRSISNGRTGGSVSSSSDPQHTSLSLGEPLSLAESLAGKQSADKKGTGRRVSNRASSRDPPGRSESILKNCSSSSSLEESSGNRRHRVSRRKGQKRAPQRKAKVENKQDEFGDSFQLSFSSHSTNDEDKKLMGTFAPFENSFEGFEASTTFQWANSIAAVEADACSTADTLCTAADIKQQLYTLAQQHKWDDVAVACRNNPWAAKHVDEEDGTTALHLAVMSRANPFLRGTSVQRAPMAVIEQLISACPEAAIVRCSLKKYTPLCYVCLVSERDFDLEDASAMAKLLLAGAPQCAMVFTDEGYSALDIHIISYSKLHGEKEEQFSFSGRSSTLLLRTLLKLCPQLVDSRPYGQRTKGPVEILYRCNLREFKAASGADVIGPKRRGLISGSVASTICDWWAWKWTMTLLEASSKRRAKMSGQSQIFSVVHAAAQIVGCPVAILCLAMDAFPSQVEQRSKNDKKLNSPLHEVCSWVTDDVVVCGDTFVQKRKSKAIAALLQAFPSASRMTNGLGETPLQLAIETCTPWDGGLGALALTFPRALLIQRTLEHLADNSPLVGALSFHDDDVGSVGPNDEDSVYGAIGVLRGMYPFMVAAALSHVPERKLRSVTPHIPDPEAKTNSIRSQLQKKSLDSLSSIYGLLRAKPQALRLYLEFAQAERDAESDTDSSSEESVGSESDDSTEALSLSDLIGHS